MRLKVLLFTTFLFCYGQVFAGNIVENVIDSKISLSNIVYSNKTEGLLKKTGQTIEYYADDDGAKQLGIAHSYTVLTTGQYSGNVNIVINGKTHVTSNACVQDENTGKMWHREIIQTDLGPANDGKLFWDQWTLTGESVTFADVGGPGTDTITAAAGNPFNITALCVGRKFTVSGTVNNDGTYTVSAIAGNVITTTEGLVNEGPVATDFATVDDLVWDLADQANANSLAFLSLFLLSFHLSIGLNLLNNS